MSEMEPVACRLVRHSNVPEMNCRLDSKNSHTVRMIAIVPLTCDLVFQLHATVMAPEIHFTSSLFPFRANTDL